MDSRRIAQEDTLTAETTSSSISTENTSSAVVKPATKPAMKRLRHVFIEAHFPELKGGQMYQHAHGEASGTKPAIARAFKEPAEDDTEEAHQRYQREDQHHDENRGGII